MVRAATAGITFDRRVEVPDGLFEISAQEPGLAHAEIGGLVQPDDGQDGLAVHHDQIVRPHGEVGIPRNRRAWKYSSPSLTASS